MDCVKAGPKLAGAKLKGGLDGWPNEKHYGTTGASVRGAYAIEMTLGWRQR